MSNPLDPIAVGLLRARSYAESIGADHRATFKLPMTPHAVTHTMRSALQALLATDRVEGFELIDNYLAFGRVEIERASDRQRYLLKSRRALPFETSYQGRLIELDNEPGAQPLQLLLYTFESETLGFATVPCERFRARNGRLKYELIGDIADAGIWSPHEIPDIEPFDQGQNDDFGDLSDDVDLGEADES